MDLNYDDKVGYVYASGLNGSGDQADPIRDGGWYFNFPNSGERVVSDVIAREGKLIVLSYTPGSSMCATGGHTWVMAMNACSGGRLSEANFDINGDGGIDDPDMVDIGTSTEILATPPRIQYMGRLQPPAILILNKQDATFHTPQSPFASRSQFRKGAPGLALLKTTRKSNHYT